MSGRRVVFDPADRGLRLREVPDPAVPGEGLLARVTMGGICGTDAHRLAGHVPPPPAAIALGHEAVGRVLALHEATSTDSAGAPLAVGDRILWYPPAACGRCHACTVRRDPSACPRIDWPSPADRAGPAGFQEVAALGPRVAVFRIPDHVPDAAAAAFGCALPTVLSGLDRIDPVPAGGSVVVLGSGPVGLAAVLALGRTDLERLVTVGTGTDRLAAARSFGATDTLDLARTTTDERRAAVLDLTGGRGADLVVEAAGVAAAVTDGLELLGHGATLLVLGLYSGDGVLPVDVVRLNNRSQRIVGSVGSHAGHVFRGLELVARAQPALGLDRLVTGRYPLENIAEAIKVTEAGEVVKAVVEP
jgi:5-exo-hydroxycamphor dehydrogenase